MWEGHSRGASTALPRACRQFRVLGQGIREGAVYATRVLTVREHMKLVRGCAGMVELPLFSRVKCCLEESKRSPQCSKVAGAR
jgi:hypothetical protein